MEVVVTEEKKKIFRARKTMKISDRQQLESLHSTLLSAAPGLSDKSSPSLPNGTHKADGPNAGDKEQSNISDSNSSCAASPASPTSLSSPAPFLSLNLSPSSASSPSPKSKEQTSPTSPFHSLNFELKKMQEVGEEGSSSSSSNQSVTRASTESKETEEKDMEVNPAMEKKEAEQTTTKDPAVDLDSSNGSAPCSSVPPPPVSDGTAPKDTDNDTKQAKDPEASIAKIKDGKQPSPKSTTSDSSLSCPSMSHPVPSSCVDPKQEKQIKEEEQSEKENVKKGPITETKMEVDSVKAEIKMEKTGASQTTKQCRPSSTPPSDTVQEGKGSTPGLKRTLSEGCEKEEQMGKRDGKRPKVERGELEAQLELKITAKAGSHHKLEKIVQQLVDDRLRALQVTIFDKHFKELKDRVDEIDCATKHQTAIKTLQVKIARLAKKFGEANQESENKRKQEQALAAAAAAAAATAKTTTVSNSPQVQRPVWTSMEVKQTSTVPSSSAVALPAPPVRAVPPAVPSLPAATAQSVLPTTSTAMVTQAPILQLITSTSNTVSTLATGITTQSPTGTLLLKTASGSSMMTAGQPLLIQLPLSMANGQAGTLVNIPVSSFSTTSSLNKAKTTTATTTFILKPAPANAAAQTSAPAAATIPALHMSTGQMSVARAVYHGGTGGITTPNAGVSMTTARTPTQSVSVAGAMSSVSSPAASGPAATGSTAPGPPQGTSLTSKTENQTAASIPSLKVATPAARPKGSVIDLTEDDDDVLVTGVKSASVAAPSPVQRPHPVASISSIAGSRSSPQSNQNSSSNPQLTIHHRPPLDSPLNSRTITTSAPTRGVALPPFPTAPTTPLLPPEAERTSPPQQPQLKLVPSQTGIVLSWCVTVADRTCAPVDSYHLYAFHQDGSNSNTALHWKKIGEVKALPLPMACTLTQFQTGSTYHFVVRAKDIYGRFGPFCEPQCSNVFNANSS